MNTHLVEICEAVRAAREAERLADWKFGGPVKETAERAAGRAWDKAERLTLEFHRKEIKQEEICRTK